MTKRKNKIVSQSNKLIETRCKLSVSEQRLLAIMIADISPNDKDFKIYSYKVSDIVGWLKLGRKDMHFELKNITGRLRNRGLTIQTEEGELQTSWLSSALYIDKKGIVKLRFDPNLKPYLLELQSCFTEYALDEFLSLKSKYAMKLFKLLKQYLEIGKRRFSLNKLREHLDLEKTELKQWIHFKTRVLDISKREINKKTSIKINYSVEKIGRKIEFVVFSIKQKDEKQEKDPEIVQNLEELFHLVPERYRNLKTLRSGIEKYFEKEGVEYTKRNIQYANAKSQKNYRTFLLKALQEDWGLDWVEGQASQSGPGTQVSPEIQKLRDKYAGTWRDTDGTYCTLIVDSSGRILLGGREVSPEILTGWKKS